MTTQPTRMDRWEVSDEELDELTLLQTGEIVADAKRRRAARRAKWRRRVRRVLLLARD